MRATWPMLHASLVGGLNRRSSESQFQELRAAAPMLSVFLEPSELLLHQHDISADHSLRYDVIRALVVTAQGDPAIRSLATTLTILALWPALDAVHGRLWRMFPNERADLAGELIARIGTGILTVDLTRVEKVAATLVRNVARDLTQDLARLRDRARCQIQIDDDALGTLGLQCLRAETPSDGEDVAMDCLDVVSAADRDLLHRVVQSGATQQEAAGALGLTHSATRKRYQRALASVRKEYLRRVSHSTPGLGLYPLKDRKGRSGTEIGS